MEDWNIGDGPYHVNPFQASKCPMIYEEMDQAKIPRQTDPEPNEPVNEAICEAQVEAFTAVGTSLEQEAVQADL